MKTLFGGPPQLASLTVIVSGRSQLWPSGPPQPQAELSLQALMLRIEQLEARLGAEQAAPAVDRASASAGEAPAAGGVVGDRARRG